MNQVSIPRHAKRAFQLSFLSLALAALLAAQTETATIRGTVKDTAGKVLPRIVLVITEMATNTTIRVVETDSKGDYEALYLKPGSYKLSILQKGYQTFLQDAIQVGPSEIRRVDPVLPAGEPEDTAATHAPPEPLGHTTGTIRDTVDGAQFPAAPEVDRFPSPFPLLATTAGVQGSGVQLAPSLVMGGISDRNLQSYQMDSIPDDLTTGIYAHPYFYEFIQSTTSNAGLDAYRPASFDLVTKRGGDGFHGSAFAQRGDSRADARPFFSPQRDDYHYLEGGGDAGGVILKERLYFYGGWVYQANPESENVYANVPTLQERVRDFSQYLNPSTNPTGQVVVIRDPRNQAPFPDNQVPSNRVLAIPNNILNQGYYPTPNVGGANSFFQNYTFVHPFGPYLYRGNWPIGRLDMRIADENHVTFRWMQSITSNVQPGTTGELLDVTQEHKYSGIEAADTETVTPYLVNHLVFGYNTDTVLQGQGVGKESPLTGDNALNSLGIQGLNPDDHSVMGFPSITVSGGLSPLAMPFGGGATNNVGENDSILALRDDVAWSKAGHSFKLGGDFTRFNSLQGQVPLLNYGAFNFNGMFTGLGFADFLLGLPATSSRILQPRVDEKIHQTLGGAYISDSFQVTSKLHLDYGVRWDYYGSPRYNDGYMWNWNPTTGAVVVAPGTLTYVNQYYPTNIQVAEGSVVPKAKTTNLRPRIAAAYRLSDNLVLRGGFAEYTDGGGFGANGRINDPNGPFQLTETYYNTNNNGLIAYAWPNAFPTTLTSALVGPQNVNALPPRTQEGVIRQYNATVERVVSGMILRASLIGARGVGMNYTVNVNEAKPSTTPITQARLPLPQFAVANDTYTNGSWHYDSGQVQAQKRVGAVVFDSNFTYANNISNYANTYDPYHVTNKWTRDAGDRRLFFVTNATWALPLGKGKKFMSGAGETTNKIVSDWSLAGIVTLASGQYYSPLFTANTDPANAVVGQVTELPDCIGNPNTGARNLNQWFNPKAFAIPSANAGRYGTCGMNTLEGFPTHVAHASLSKSLAVADWLTATLIFQATDITNSPHFTFPQNNISNPGAGAFTAASMVDATYPERDGYRQIDVKLRLVW